MQYAMSDQRFDRDNTPGRKPIRKWVWLWLILLGIATVVWLAGLAWAAIWLFERALF
jgi:hypothetical protein